MLAGLVADTIAWLIGDKIADWFIRRAKVRKAQAGTFDCGFRVISGRHPGLGADWRLGMGTVSPGRVQLESVTIDLLEVDTASRRPARLRDTLGGAETSIFRVTTDGAELEWSLLAVVADQAVDAVRPVVPRAQESRD